MRKHLALFALLFAGINILFAQTTPNQEISGYVFERDTKGNLKPLPGAHVYSVTNQNGSVTDQKGFFLIYTDHPFPQSISASFVGYESDTIEVKKAKAIEFVLSPSTLNEVKLIERKKTNAKSILKVSNVEWISGQELQKAACCNLSECFETNASVDIISSDAITGAKKIQMLGLDGVYSDVLVENKPFLRGLAATYGLNYIPGSWIESIQIAKATGSVTSGFQALTGQINTELYKPETIDGFFWNSYLSSVGMIENNFITASFVGKDWKTALLGHYSYLGRSIDRNGDSFVDEIAINRIALLNRWRYIARPDRHIEFSFRYLSEDKLSGQISGDDLNTESFEFDSPYEVEIKTEQAEFNSKIGHIFNKPFTSVGITSQIRYHKQESSFGGSMYSGAQYSLYVKASYQSTIIDTTKLYKIGLSYYGDRYDETLLLLRPSTPYVYEGLYVRTDQTLGAYTELIVSHSPRLSSIIGYRADYSKDFGLWHTPRLNMRYKPTDNTAFRLSAGKAYRQANPISENMSYLFSSRNLVLEDYNSLKPEEAINYGANINHNFYIAGKATSFNIDIYQTDFQNQVVADIEQTQKLAIYNLEGPSNSKSLQLDFTFEPADGWELKYAHKWNKTQTTYNIETDSGLDYVTKQAPFIPKYRSLVQVYYTTWQKKWDINITLQNVGPSRVPGQGDIEEFWSDNFNLLSGQITRRFKKFDWYIGVENALNYMQPNPIRGVENPFSDNFDAGMIWGPVMGTKWFTGIRLNMNN
ncbi:MAG: hypothetical protein CND86_00765 [Bacteroidetes bacterium MED-G21]|nr:MAG: hypothetical protein CND86_00765 [Bacteroidetes bacterium MED-G21]